MRKGTQAWGFAVCVASLVLLAVPSAFGYGWVPVTNPATQTISGVSFTSADNGWIVEENGCVFHTVDGGANWTTVTVDSSAPLRGVSFADPDHGWITGDSGTVRHTSDGGATWQTQGMGYNASLSRPFVLDSLHAWIPAPGGGGLIVKTDDGGSWWPGVVGGFDSFYGVSFSDALNGWAVGSFGAIRRSIDGGSTWETRTAGTFSEWLSSASAIDSRTAFAVSSSGSALWLHDDAQNWEYEVQATPVGSLKTVKAFSGGEVFAAGWDAIIHTHDWGQTWVKVHSPGSVELVDLSFPDPYNGFAAGQSGTLLKYTAPTAPVAHSLEATDASSVWVTWDASPDAAGYQVRYGKSTGTVNGGATTTRSLSLSAPGTTEFAVRAFTSENLYSAWSTATITNHVAFVAAPVVTAKSTVTTSSVAVSWNAVPTAVRYEYRVNGGAAVRTLATTATVSSSLRGAISSRSAPGRSFRGAPGDPIPSPSSCSGRKRSCCTAPPQARRTRRRTSGSTERPEATPPRSLSNRWSLEARGSPRRSPLGRHPQESCQPSRSRSRAERTTGFVSLETYTSHPRCRMRSMRPTSRF